MGRIKQAQLERIDRRIEDYASGTLNREECAQILIQEEHQDEEYTRDSLMEIDSRAIGTLEDDGYGVWALLTDKRFHFPFLQSYPNDADAWRAAEDYAEANNHRPERH